MTGFVTWPPFSYQDYYRGGKVTMPVTLVKICYTLLYVIRVIEVTDIKAFGCIYVPAASD